MWWLGQLAQTDNCYRCLNLIHWQLVVGILASGWLWGLVDRIDSCFPKWIPNCWQFVGGSFGVFASLWAQVDWIDSCYWMLIPSWWWFVAGILVLRGLVEKVERTGSCCRKLVLNQRSQLAAELRGRRNCRPGGRIGFGMWIREDRSYLRAGRRSSGGDGIGGIGCLAEQAWKCAETGGRWICRLKLRLVL